MPIYLVTFEFDDDGNKIQDELEYSLGRLGSTCRPMRRVWAVETEADPERVTDQVRDTLKRIGEDVVGESPSFLVVPTAAEWQGDDVLAQTRCIDRNPRR